MSKVQILRALVNQRLNAAAEEIFGLFERTIAEYEEELCRSKQENDRQRHLLDATADRQQILVGKEQGPTAKQDQEDPDPPHIKEENLELWTSQEGLQHQDQEVAEMNFQLTPVPVKSETDEKKPQASQLHQRSADYNAETQPGADYEASHSHRNSDPSMCQQPPWILVPVSKPGRSKLHSFSCSECGRCFDRKNNLTRHMRTHTGEKPYSCPICFKRFTQTGHVTQHVRIHTGEKRFSCRICNKRFTWQNQVKSHVCAGGSSKLHQNQTKENREAESPARRKTKR